MQNVRFVDAFSARRRIVNEHLCFFVAGGSAPKSGACSGGLLKHIVASVVSVDTDRCVLRYSLVRHLVRERVVFQKQRAQSQSPSTNKKMKSDATVPRWVGRCLRLSQTFCSLETSRPGFPFLRILTFKSADRIGQPTI